MGAGGISIWQLLIVLVIVLLLFGTKRLKGLGSDLGNAVKGFRSAMSESEKVEEASAPKPSDQPADMRSTGSDTTSATSSTANVSDKPRV